MSEIGNEELAYLFTESREKKHKPNPELVKLYKLDDITISIPEAGEVVSAKFEGKQSDQFIFSAPGYKDFIRVDDKSGEAKYLKNTEFGDEIDLLITQVNHKNFMIKGSLVSLYETRAHQNLLSLEEGTAVTVQVKCLTPAGYSVDLMHGGVTLPGFMPNTLAGINKLHDPNSIIGQTFDVMIESYSEHEGTYIVSRRKYLHTLIPEAIKKLNYNQIYTGHVTGTTPFGVFVEFSECLTGMIHKANVNIDWQDRLSEISPGFKIDFYIKEIIKDKIILTQILRETLWDVIKGGQTINGVVKDIKQFGVLVGLDSETTGLIHTSEMEKINKTFSIGQELKVRVISVDRCSRKIFLTA
jgi:ribosomal protein S1